MERVLHREGDWFAITKHLGNGKLGMSAEQEAKRRIRAAQIHKKILPEHTLECEFEIEGNRLIRRSPYQEGVVTLSEMPTSSIISEQKIASAVSKVYFAYFKQITRYKRIFDCYGFGDFGKEWPQALRIIARPMLSHNIMVAQGERGARVFCDPDWFITTEEFLRKGGAGGKSNRPRDLTVRQIYILRSSLFFGLAAKNASVRELSSKSALGAAK